MSFITRLGLIGCLLFTLHSVHAQDVSYYLQGTVGAYPVAMRISCYEDTNCSDTRYYYKKVLKDIVLEGTKKGNHFVLGTSQYNEQAVRETIQSATTGRPVLYRYLDIRR